MTTYKKAGVDIKKGDKCSEIAYKAAKSTFASRKNMIGAPFTQNGGFTGALDMGDYYMVFNCDGVGTKVEVAELTGKYDTLGYDLLAMVADDAVCAGAEVISIVNTIDTNRVSEKVTQEMMKGLAKACREQKIVIAGGEIAELSTLVNGVTWNASAIGIVEKEKFITGAKIQKGDVIIGLLSRGFRSNGFTLVRHILKNAFGQNWHKKQYNRKMTWGEVVLTPSLVYHRAVLEMIGGFREKRSADIHGIVHVTGGGIYNNTARIIPSGLRADFDNLPEPHPFMLDLMEIGKVSRAEAYRTWNMGVGMVLICPEKEIKKITHIAQKNGIGMQRIGKILSVKNVAQ